MLSVLEAGLPKSSLVVGFDRATIQDRCYGLFTDEQQEILASTIIKVEGNMTSGDAQDDIIARTGHEL
ncbi:hypothetical protein A8140_23100 [Vibrio campbellii CAIM 519 = NBRC 15631 = ATCC 25920]|nr:hypothetical protein A8140_23100 [Vibrio campbellii CAIM 519 = NBRC 15631 = ATCC 25920]ELU53199.1 pyruvate formate lyase [Vibrio campbellii CAIM 519 = NBRC 15631 = ATCC 25920]